jgi:hypothetical protein
MLSVALGLLSAASYIVCAVFWGLSAYRPRQPGTGAQMEVLRGGTNAERERTAKLNRCAALFTGIGALLSAAAVLAGLKSM